MATVADPRAETREQMTLALEGMTCASCAARIERTLNKVEGVEATVTFATVTIGPDGIATPPVDVMVAGAVEDERWHADRRQDLPDVDVGVHA